MRSDWLIIRRALTKDWRQLLLTTGAITLAVLILVSFTSVFTALFARSQGPLWIYPSDAQFEKREGVQPIAMTTERFSTVMMWQGQAITTVSVANVTDDAPKLDSVQMPRVNEYYLSPALEKIVKEHPSNMLANRFGTKYLGSIPYQYLESPSTLLVVRGVPYEQIKDVATMNVYSFATGASMISASDESIIRGSLYMGVAIVLVPVLLLIAISIRVGSAQRAQRYAALRLIGFTKRQVRFSILLESWVASFAGIALGVLLYLACLPLLGQVHFLGAPFWPETLRLSGDAYIYIAFATVVFVSIANWWGLRHVEASPLGVARTHGAEKKPRVWSLLPLMAGIGCAVYTMTSHDDLSARMNLFILAVVVTMFGLFLAGPYATYQVSKLVGKGARSALTLLGVQYIARHARGVFRGVGGVVLALFAGTFYLISVSGIAAFVTSFDKTAMQTLRHDAVYVTGVDIDAKVFERMRSVHGVQRFTFVPASEDGQILLTCGDVHAYFDTQIPCNQLTAQIAINLDGSEKDMQKPPKQGMEMPRGEGLLLIVQDEKVIESLRTVLAESTTIRNYVSVQGGSEVDAVTRDGNASLVIVEELGTLAYFGMILTVVVAVVSLSISTIGSLMERRRSLVTLRLIGVTSRQQKQIVLVESLMPLLLVSAVSVAIGAWFGVSFIDIFAQGRLHAEVTPLFVGVLVGSLLLAIAGISFALHFLGRLVAVDAIRDE